MITIESFVKKVMTAGPGDSLASVARSMEQHNVGAVVIVEGGRPRGVVTDRDLALQLGSHGASPRAPVVSVMSTPVKMVRFDEGVFDTTRTLMESGVRRLPVVDDDDRLVGLVALDDLLRVLSRELTHLAEGIKSEMEVK